jgi:hypothetical protein
MVGFLKNWFGSRFTKTDAPDLDPIPQSDMDGKSEIDLE